MLQRWRTWQHVVNWTRMLQDCRRSVTFCRGGMHIKMLQHHDPSVVSVQCKFWGKSSITTRAQEYLLLRWSDRRSWCMSLIQFRIACCFTSSAVVWGCDSVRLSGPDCDVLSLFGVQFHILCCFISSALVWGCESVRLSGLVLWCLEFIWGSCQGGWNESRVCVTALPWMLQTLSAAQQQELEAIIGTA